MGIAKALNAASSVAFPWGMDIDPATNTLWVAEWQNHRVTHRSPADVKMVFLSSAAGHGR